MIYIVQHIHKFYGDLLGMYLIKTERVIEEISIGEIVAKCHIDFNPLMEEIETDTFTVIDMDTLE